MSAARTPDSANLFIVGAMKAATTSLATALGGDLNIFLPSVKEPGYFAQTEDTPNPAYSLLSPHSRSWDSVAPYGWRRFDTFEKYSLLYREAVSPYRLDASTIYLPSPDAAKNIAAHDPASRIIMVLRNPYLRAHSGYYFLSSQGREPAASFDAALAHELSGARDGWYHAWRHLQTSLYTEQVRRYLTALDPSRVLVLFFEDLTGDYARTMRSIYSFLALECPPEFPPLPRENVTRVQHRPFIRALKDVLLLDTPRRLARRVLPDPLVRLPKSALDAIVRWADSAGSAAPALSDTAIAQMRPYVEPDIDALEVLLDRDLSTWRLGRQHASAA
jgi:hypothetical protein